MKGNNFDRQKISYLFNLKLRNYILSRDEKHTLYMDLKEDVCNFRLDNEYITIATFSFNNDKLLRFNLINHLKKLGKYDVISTKKRKKKRR